VVGATAEEDNDTNRGKGSLRGLLLKIIFLNKVFNETYWIAIQFRGVCENVLKDWFVIVFSGRGAADPPLYFLHGLAQPMSGLGASRKGRSTAPHMVARAPSRYAAGRHNHSTKTRRLCVRQATQGGRPALGANPSVRCFDRDTVPHCCFSFRWSPRLRPS
jgi:hypothetical protein